MPLERKAYTGLTRRLVLAFDIGTTCSGISFCMLQPGKVPEPEGVLKYPKHGKISDAKVPSVLCYDSEGNFKAAGYDALTDEMTEAVFTEGWVKLEWWKLHLRPKHLSSVHIKDDDIPPLPKGKFIVDVLKDFIKYLFHCAELYIQETRPAYIWLSVKDEIEFVFTHPNGWEGAQQQQIRCAIELAGLVPGTPDGRARVRFLTEGEAGLHFCIWDLFTSEVPNQEKYPEGQGIVVIDAGGGTIDTSMYSMRSDPPSFKEIAPAECCLQGSVFVTRRAKILLQEKLKGSDFSKPDSIEEITNTFDQTTKLHVCDAEQSVHIKIASLRCNDPDHGIRAGKLRLSGQEVTRLFDDSISAIIDAFEQQQNYATIPITMAFLIGGFGANDWLLSQLKSYFDVRRIELIRPSKVHKAVPDGALSYLVDHLVHSRVARATYGTACSTTVDDTDPEHLARKDIWFLNAAGQYAIPVGFSPILRKGVQANEFEEFRCSFCFMMESQTDFGVQTLPIMYYQGALPDPRWLDEDEGRPPPSFSTLCTIPCDLSDAAKTLVPRPKLSGERGIYYQLDIDVIILFGNTEFTAQVAWKAGGVENRSSVALVYDDI